MSGIYLLPRALICLLLSLASLGAAAQERAGISPLAEEARSDIQTAPVIIDGDTLFTVRGVSAFPAEKRAQRIAERIRAVAKDSSVSTQSLRVAEAPYGTQIWSGNQLLITVLDEDARLESTQRQIVAQAYSARIRESIENFRRDRHARVLIRHGIYAFAATLALILLLLVGLRIVRRLRSSLERRYKDKIHGVGIQAFQLLHARHIWNLIIGAIAFVGAIVFFLASYATLYHILSLFPWTRGVSKNLSRFFLDPLRILSTAFVSAIPDLIFLAILAVLTFYVLKLIRLVFAALESGALTMSGFDPEWARPTYRLTRGFVIAFALVVAFPYMPGSHTQAFKGLSLFIGLIFSLGSTSLIGNLISGYSLSYRRLFRVGDRIKIGDYVGYVQESKLMVTYLRTIKNEVVAVPNSQIINSEVVNYSALARTEGLVLHTTVGIGYETPWRQVKAMLIEAATRTRGLLSDPKPFVRQKELGNFAVTYEINAYCDQPAEVERLYTDLHENILDVFNEYGVQIMTPAYEGDPEQAKVVPKRNWYAAPASTASLTTVRSDSDGNAQSALMTGT
jgi:small-conductance mechanosensitive channel